MQREFSADDMLPLSGIQHFCFCRRQWALIQVENQWKDNLLTAEGKGMHERADDPFFAEMRSGAVITRSVPVSSRRLGFSGICDVVEFQPSENGISMPQRSGTFRPVPIEYKHGIPKHDRSDEAQLCAQAICLEEMLSTVIQAGYLYYVKTRHRQEIVFDIDLRDFVFKMAAEMHAYFERGHTPKVKTSRACQSCSLKDICLPELLDETTSASSYIQQQIEGGG